MKDKFIQLVLSLLTGAWLAIETASLFFVPCLLATALDVASAYFLARRVHAKYPDRANGKFKSEYKQKILNTLGIAFVVVILAHYVDSHVLQNTDIVVRFTVGTFLFYQVWSVLENWSSESDNKFAKLLQRVMVNKIERHLEVDLSDLKEDKEK